MVMLEIRLVRSPSFIARWFIACLKPAASEQGMSQHVARVVCSVVCAHPCNADNHGSTHEAAAV